MNFTKSQDLYTRAAKVVPSGVHSNARIRSPHPLYYEKAKGAQVWDVDGNEYLDCVMGFGSIILGHGNEKVSENVQKALKNGITLGFETELSVKVAEQICDFMGGGIRLRFTNTGTEASLHTLRVSRAITGKEKIAKVEGSYHGWSDAVSVSIWPDLSKVGEIDSPKSVPGTKGLLRNAVDNTVVIPFNDIQNSVRIIEENKDELAAVILEPALIDIGYVPPTREYLESLRKVTDKHGIILIFDELLTGFRLSLGGAQSFYDVKPDLIMLGKAISNGFPLAVLAGKPEIMKEFGGGGSTNFNGTYNGHAISLAAAEATLQILKTENVIEQLNKHTVQLQKSFDESAKKYGVDAFLAGKAGHFHPYFTKEEIYDYRSAATTNAKNYNIFINSLISQGVVVSGNPLHHHAISMSHSDEQIKDLGNKFDVALREIGEKSN